MKVPGFLTSNLKIYGFETRPSVYIMNAVSVYIATCRYIVQTDQFDEDSLADLHRYLPYLRQAIACCVCGKVIQDPRGPEDNFCQHHVCRGCVGGKMRLKPSCSWCKRHEQFVDNPQLKIVVQCFKTLCQYLASPTVSASLARSKSSNGCTNNLMAIIQEGVSLGQPNDSGAAGQTVTLEQTVPVFPSSLQRLNKLRFKRQRRQRGGYKRYSTSRLMFGRVPKVADTQNDVAVVSDNSSQQELLATNAATEATTCCENGLSVNSDSRVDAPVTASSHVPPPCKKLKSHNSEPVIPSPLATSVVKQRKPLHKTTGCRCGLATRTPGSLTCCGQRCPCYSSFKGCSDCICRGCRNPRGDLKPGVSETFVSVGNTSDTDPMIVVDV